MTEMSEELDLPDFFQNAVKEAVNVEKFKEFKIVATQGSSKGDGYMGEIYRIIVKGVKDDDSMHSIHLILKTSPKLKKRREFFPVTLLYKREIYVYSKLLPLYDKLQDQYNVPQEDRFRHAKLFNATNEEYNELLIFEDLNKKGFVMRDKRIPYDYDHISLLIKNLARFHAMSIVIKAKDPTAFQDILSNTSNHLELGDEFLSLIENTDRKVLPIIEDEEEQRRTVSYLKDAVEEIKRLLNSETAAPYNVICHGDCWSNNFLFKYKEGKLVDLRLVDFQVIRYASPITDLAYLIFLGTDKALRDNHYEELLTLYYETLRNTVTLMDIDISEHFPEDVYRKQIKEFMKYGFIVSCAFLTFIMADPNDMPELEDIIEKSPEGEFAYCDQSIKRIRDTIKFSMEIGII